MILVATAFSPAARATDSAKPKVRAITGFINIDAKSYPAQFAEAAKFLGQVREAIRAAGYEVQGIRITTQPFPDYTRIGGQGALLRQHRSCHVERQRQHRTGGGFDRRAIDAG
jgi:hypothetical protein